MKRIITAVLVVAATSAAYTQQSSDIAIVHARDLVEGYWKYPPAQKKLLEERDKVMGQVASMRQEVLDLTNKLRNLEMSIKSPLLSNDARKIKEKEFSDGKMLLRQKHIKLMDTEKRLKAQLMRSKQIAQTELRKQISEQIRVYAKKKGLKLVLDDSTPISGVMFSSPSLDITKEVLALLNAGHEDDVKRNAEEKAKAEAQRADEKAKAEAGLLAPGGELP